MKYRYLIIFFSFFFLGGVKAQILNETCITSETICFDIGEVHQVNVNSGTAEVGPDYGCLATQPNPAWFNFQIDQSGDFDFLITPSNSAVDADFIVYGPYFNQVTPCTSSLVTGATVDCSYAVGNADTVNIPGAVQGQYYLLLVTNFTNDTSNISFNVTPSSTATINCTYICPPIEFGVLNGSNVNPLPSFISCADTTLMLYANSDSVNIGESITPCISIEIFPTNANTTLSVEFLENGMATFGTQSAPSNVNYTMTYTYVDPNAVLSFILNEVSAIGDNMTYRLVDCNSGFVFATGTWVDDGAPQTVNVPQNLLGISYFSISPPTGNAALTTTDWGSAYFNPSLITAGTYDITYNWDDGAGNCSGQITHSITIGSVNIGITDSVEYLISDAIGALYRWLDCDNNYTEIIGETGQSFYPTISGNYAVEVNQNGCIDTSACLFVNATDIEEKSLWKSLSIYPNPTSGNFSLNFSDFIDIVEFQLINSQGKVLMTFEEEKTKSKIISLEEYKAGLYFIKITIQGDTKNYSIIKY